LIAYRGGVATPQRPIWVLGNEDMRRDLSTLIGPADVRRMQRSIATYQLAIVLLVGVGSLLGGLVRLQAETALKYAIIADVAICWPLLLGTRLLHLRTVRTILERHGADMTHHVWQRMPGAVDVAIEVADATMPGDGIATGPELAALRDRMEDRYNAREARLVARRPARIFATVVALGVLITAALLALVSYESSGPPAPPPTTVPLAQIPNFPTDFDCDAKTVDIVSVPPHTDAELIGTCRLTDGSRLTYAIFPTRDLAEIWAQQQRASAATPGEQVLVGDGWAVASADPPSLAVAARFGAGR
jgi:hypothetical protein